MHLNQGRFLTNGFCGYILKPEFMRSLSSQFDPNTLPKGPWLKKKVFHIMVRFVPGNCSQECVLCEICLYKHTNPHHGETTVALWTSDFNILMCDCCYVCVSKPKVISAQQLPKINKDKPKSIVDPLVRVELYGVPADNASKETHYIENNGDHNTHKHSQRRTFFSLLRAFVAYFSRN